MRDDASRARLEEMGFDIYVPRAASAPAQSVPVVGSRARPRVALLSRTESALLSQVARALAFARVDAAVAPGAKRIGDAVGLVVFGESLAREIGAALPPGRKESMGWVGAAEPAEITGSVAAKRALWSELKRLARALAKV